MSRYLGPRFRILRRLGGVLPAFCSSKPRGKTGHKTPGQHGKPRVLPFSKQQSRESAYSLRLKAKQRLRYNYHVTERQLFNYVKKARKIKGPTGKNLLILLEMRLDNIVYRMGLARTIVAARQYINHGHLTVNNQKVTIPSYNCQVLDTIRIRNKKKSRRLMRMALIPYVAPKSKTKQKNKKGPKAPGTGMFKGGKKRGTSQTKLANQTQLGNQNKAGKRDPKGYKKKVTTEDINKNKRLYSKYRIPKYLSVCRKTLTGVVKHIVPRKQVRLNIDELLVVEYYSRS